MKIQYTLVFPFTTGHVHYFGRCERDAEERKCSIDNDDWWANRYQVFVDYTLRSLCNQQNKAFDIVFLTYPGYEKRLYRLVKFVTMVGLTARIVTGLPHLIDLYKKNDYWVWVHLDSDDMLSADAMNHIRSLDVSGGLVSYFHTGYLLNLVDGSLHNYDSLSVCPPFFSLVYSRDSLSSYAKFLDYRNSHGYNCHHWQMRQCTTSIRLPDGNFCVTAHRKNTTTALRSAATNSKVFGEVVGDDKKRVLAKFGVNRK